MERNQVLVEYRKLCNLLNQGNKLANEKTEIKFMIELVRPSEFRLVLVKTSLYEMHKIEVAEKIRRENWERSGLTEFKEFELFCANYLTVHEKSKLKDKIFLNCTQSEIFEILAIDLQKIFDDWMTDYRP